MEYIKATEYGTRVDVYFDGEKYVFINAFHGVVAIATRMGIVDFTDNGNTGHVKFHVEKTRGTISKTLIQRVIKKAESKFVPTVVQYDYDETGAECLPVFVSVNVTRRK